MRMRLFLAAVIAILLVADQSAHAQTRPGRCADAPFTFVRNGTTHLEGYTTAGHPCQVGFGMMGGNVEALQVVVRPTHGMLGTSEKEANRRFVAYAPKAGFVGRDRFEVFARITPARGGPAYTTRLIVEMIVIP
jgi:hypothetical protein